MVLFGVENFNVENFQNPFIKVFVIRNELIYGRLSCEEFFGNILVTK